MWQWSQHIHRQCCLQGKEPLLLNLGETSVPVVFTGGKGNIVAYRGKGRPENDATTTARPLPHENVLHPRRNNLQQAGNPAVAAASQIRRCDVNLNG